MNENARYREKIDPKFRQDGACFARTTKRRCSILNGDDKNNIDFNGRKCPFMKPKRSVTNGVRY